MQVHPDRSSRPTATVLDFGAAVNLRVLTVGVPDASYLDRRHRFFDVTLPENLRTFRSFVILDLDSVRSLWRCPFLHTFHTLNVNGFGTSALAPGFVRPPSLRKLVCYVSLEPHPWAYPGEVSRALRVTQALFGVAENVVGTRDPSGALKQVLQLPEGL